MDAGPTELHDDRDAVADAGALAPDPILLLDRDTSLRWANRAAEESFGWRLEDWLGRTVVDLIHPDDLVDALNSIDSVGGKSVGTLVELRVRDGDGGWRRVEVRGRSLGDGQLLLVVRDLSDRSAWDVAEGDTDLLRAILEYSSTPVLTCTDGGIVRSASAALPRALGVDREGLLGRPLSDLAAPGHVVRVDRLFAGADRRQVVDVVLLDVDGGERPFRLEVTDLRDDPSVRGFVAFAHDTGDLQAALSELEQMTRVDPLTGLLNRSALLCELRRMLTPPSAPVAVFFIDLDGFKAINDLHGHRRGDEVLCAVATRLSEVVRGTDIVARLGGDEFVVACAMDDEVALEAMEARLEEAVTHPAPSGSGRAAVGASIGKVLVVPGAMTAEEAVAEADSEMYRQKAWRRGLDALPASAGTRRRMAAELSLAFDRGEIEPHFQPIVALPGGKVVGYETLARWRHPERGLLTPGEFLPVCEEAGLEGRLAAVTIRGAVELLERLPVDQRVAVNLSALQLADPGIAGALLETVGSEDAPRVVVEVTEHSVIERTTRDGRPVTDVLAELGAAGFGVAIDDFGTGSASLSRLVRVPATMLKVDRSFVAGLGLDAVADALVRAVVGLAAELGLSVVAEGVETLEQEQLLVDMGCDHAQGWRYGAAETMQAVLGSADTVADT